MPITADDFTITRTPKGYHTIRWKHNNARLQTYRDPNSLKRAKTYIKWLVEWSQKEGVEVDSIREDT